MAGDDRPEVLVIAGPTASGKSARALAIAGTRNGVVINADSMQVYDALPILTARPTPGDCAAVPHDLYAVLPPSEKCTAQLWAQRARKSIDAAHAAGRLPIVTGGTGFYIRALIKGLSPIPDVPPDIRAGALRLMADLGNEEFHRCLSARDPVMGARLPAGDTQRLIRAWEVLEATGESLSAWQAKPGAQTPYRFTIDLIMPDRADLVRRCDERFDAMIAAGAREEIDAFDTKIRAGEVPHDAAVTHAHGFRPLQAHIRGDISLETAVERSKIETRQYAKRQMTWFRHQILSE